MRRKHFVQSIDQRNGRCVGRRVLLLLFMFTAEIEIVARLCGRFDLFPGFVTESEKSQVPVAASALFVNRSPEHRMPHWSIGVSVAPTEVIPSTINNVSVLRVSAEICSDWM